MKSSAFILLIWLYSGVVPFVSAGFIPHPQKESSLQDRAIEKAREAISLLEAKEGLESPAVASALTRLAGLLKAKGAYEEAEKQYERALGIVEGAFGPHHPEAAA